VAKILITGGEGFLGAFLARKHFELGDEVSVLDIRRQDKLDCYKDEARVRRITGDVRLPEHVEPLIAESDMVYHFASVVGVNDYIERPRAVLDTTILGSRNVFECCLKHNKPVLFSSTSEVYGDNHNPLHEEEFRVLGPTHYERWTYSSSKAVAEHYAYAMQREGLRFIIVRYFNVYGPELDSPGKGRIISKFIGNLQKGEALHLVDGGQAVRSFCYVDDAIEATVKLAQARTWGEVVNIGTGRGVTMKQVAELVNSLAARPVPLEIISGEKEFGVGFQEIHHRVPVVDKLHKLTGYRAETSLENGLRKTLEYYGLAR